MIAAAYWAGYLAAHPAWPLIFAACCAAAAAFVALMRAEDKRDDRAAGLPQAPRRGTRFRAGGLTALARGTSWGRRAIALRIKGITVDVGGERAPTDPSQPGYGSLANRSEPGANPPGWEDSPEPTRLATGAERAGGGLPGEWWLTPAERLTPPEWLAAEVAATRPWADDTGTFTRICAEEA